MLVRRANLLCQISKTRLIPRAGRRTIVAMKNGKLRTPDRLNKRVELGKYIVADTEICHGQPTFKGTRIMVWQVLDDVAEGRSWEFICNSRWGGRLPLAAVAEALKLARAAWLPEHGRLARNAFTKDASLAAA